MANTIHPTAIIEEGVVLGDNNVIEAYSVIRKGSTIGNFNLIESFSVIGATPSSDTYGNLPSGVVIGDNNIIGCNTIIQKGLGFKSNTTIGNRNNIFNNVVIGHDCTVGNDCLLNAFVGLTGYVHIGNHVTLCPYVGVAVADLDGITQTCIGDYSMITGYSRITNNVPPMALVTNGYNPVIRSYNADKIPQVLLDFPEETIESITTILKDCNSATSGLEVRNNLTTNYPDSKFAKFLSRAYSSYRNITKRKKDADI